MPRINKLEHPIDTRFPPAKTAEAREEQLTALAMDLAERQMRDGTASPLVISHFLKLGTERAKLESERIKKETLLANAKVQQIDQQSDIANLVADVKQALKEYSPDEETYDE